MEYAAIKAESLPGSAVDAFPIMRILKVLPLVSSLGLAATIGCAHDKVAKNDIPAPAYSGTESSTRLTPTSDRPGETHIYSNATSRAVRSEERRVGKECRSRW